MTGAKEPQSAANRKAKQRSKAKESGLVRVKFPELWVSPDNAHAIEFNCAQIIAKIIRG